MIIRECEVSAVQEVARGIHVLAFECPEVGSSALPGQFINIRVDRSTEPLLRRPFSIYRTDGTTVEIIFNVVGKGTAILAARRPGDAVNVLGPLGVPFGTSGPFSTALLVAGGLGIAPMPILADHLRKAGIRVEVFAGSRSADQLVPDHLENVHVATDDGSRGFHGTVVALLEGYLREHPAVSPKVFGCGPTRMLTALSEFARNAGIACELSLEGDMACGIGICQGCPVERVSGSPRYALVCTHGPTFDCTTIQLSSA